MAVLPHLHYLTSQAPIQNVPDQPLPLPPPEQLSHVWEAISNTCSTFAMKFATHFRLLSLLSLNLAVHTVPSSAAVGGECDVVTTQDTIPAYPVALQEYSYCGGYLNVTAWVQNVNYNKVIKLYYADALGEVTPLNVISLGWVQMVEQTNYAWELWAAETPVFLDGVTKLINITYDALDIRESYAQDLNINVEPSGPPPPDPPPDPTPYADPQGFSSDISDYLRISKSTQPGICKTRMFDNISPVGAVKGLVTAAQSRAEPDYWYHWVRDAALTMDVVVMLYEAASRSKKGFYEQRLFWYAQASADEQNDPTAITGLAEPKFYLNNNTGYTGPWGRPQHDGPGSRAITLIHFAETYLKKGGSKDTVLKKLWDSYTYPSTAPILRDLDYVTQYWQSESFDLWEEVSSHHFYNRMVHRKALLMGAAFAKKLGSSYTSQAILYEAVAKEIEASLAPFWNQQRGLLLYEYGPVLRGKASYKDISVVLGVLHGYNGDDVYGYTNDHILATAYHIATSFLEVYPIANVTRDARGNPLGIPIGRYPEDVYDGVGTSRGNPWYLTTAAMAELFYNAAYTFSALDAITVTPTTQKFWKYFAPDADPTLGRKYSSRSHTFKEMVRGLQGWGDMWIRTVKYWSPADGRFPEEFDRETGKGVGAKDLTWSYASVITAGAARARAVGSKSWLGNLADL
ncbi:Glucoamylase [Dactylella cylindrospora]|nr:Glucoamylase [Dactylella cylindrospora]